MDIDSNDLRPLIAIVVAETFAQLEIGRQKLGGRIAYTEPEAAAMLGIQRHALRDARLRGEVQASRVGKRVIYSHAQLLNLLEQNRI